MNRVGGWVDLGIHFFPRFRGHKPGPAAKISGELSRPMSLFRRISAGVGLNKVLLNLSVFVIK
jgi:hypothetical protein